MNDDELPIIELLNRYKTPVKSSSSQGQSSGSNSSSLKKDSAPLSQAEINKLFKPGDLD